MPLKVLLICLLLLGCRPESKEVKIGQTWEVFVGECRLIENDEYRPKTLETAEGMTATFQLKYIEGRPSECTGTFVLKGGKIVSISR